MADTDKELLEIMARSFGWKDHAEAMAHADASGRMWCNPDLLNLRLLTLANIYERRD